MKTSQLSDLRDERTTLEAAGPRAAAVLTAAGVAALAAGLVLGVLRGDGLRYFYYAWLMNFCFYASITLGALFLVAILHVTRGGWGVVVRRIVEVTADNVPVLAVLFIPVLIGISSIYEWSNPQAVRGDELLEHKAPYLNVAFFIVRAVVYLAIWGLLGRFFLKKSTEQDQTGRPELTIQMERWSAPALLVLALTVTFASFDWLMSLDARWASTIYGVYYFSGAMVAALAATILIAMGLQSRGRVASAITTEHYHDLGKLLFAFVVFWGYIAFSQFMLIWYGNIPEETVWYQLRLSGSWGTVALVLLFGNLLVPFFGLISRHAKRNKPVLAFWAAWLLAMHWIDLYWLVMPRYWAAGRAAETPAGWSFALVDAALVLGIGCLYMAGLAWTASGRALVPLKDPRLGESLAFENV